MNTKTLNTYEKLWLANRASHNMALAGPTAFWLASGNREARPLQVGQKIINCIRIDLHGVAGIQVRITMRCPCSDKTIQSEDTQNWR